MMQIMFPKIPEKDGDPYNEKYHDTMTAKNIKPEVWYKCEIIGKIDMPAITNWLYDIKLIDLNVTVRILASEILRGLIKIKEDNNNDRISESR